MKNQRLKSRTGLVCLLLAGAAISAAALDTSTFVVPLRNAGGDPDAAGSVVGSLNPRGSYLFIRASKLTPGATYILALDGRAKASLRANSAGVAQFRFSNPPTNGSWQLNFDPRGSSLVLREGPTPVLQGVISGPGETPSSFVLERADLPQTKPGANRSATAQYILIGEDRRFKVTARNVAGTNLWVYVGGVPRSRLPIANGTGTVLFHNRPANRSERLLDFDPRGQVVEIASGPNLLFSGPFEARVPNVNVATPSVRPGVIPSTGAAPGAVAKTRVRTHRDAVRDFRVELEDLPPGDYELVVNGVSQATIPVATTPEGSQGEVEFSTGTDDPNKLPLLFAPLTSTFTIRQESIVLFKGKIVSRMPALATDDTVGVLEEGLLSSGLDRNARGSAKYEIRDDGRRRFSVEIEDVTPGTYSLSVDGVRRGATQAQSVGGRVEGQIEFSSADDNPHELPLTFDPRGKLIQISSAAGVLFAHMFGLGAPPARTAPPLEIELPLFSSGAGAGQAKVKFERNERTRRSLEVELEDVPLGEYSLLVGGVPRGVITVTEVFRGTHGKIELEDEPPPGGQWLNFDPLGQTLRIERGGVVWFERTLPNPTM